MYIELDNNGTEQSKYPSVLMSLVFTLFCKTLCLENHAWQQRFLGIFPWTFTNSCRYVQVHPNETGKLFSQICRILPLNEPSAAVEILCHWVFVLTREKNVSEFIQQCQ